MDFDPRFESIPALWQALYRSYHSFERLWYACIPLQARYPLELHSEDMDSLREPVSLLWHDSRHHLPALFESVPQRNLYRRMYWKLKEQSIDLARNLEDEAADFGWQIGDLRSGITERLEWIEDYKDFFLEPPTTERSEPPRPVRRDRNINKRASTSPSAAHRMDSPESEPSPPRRARAMRRTRTGGSERPSLTHSRDGGNQVEPAEEEGQELQVADEAGQRNHSLSGDARVSGWVEDGEHSPPPAYAKHGE